MTYRTILVQAEPGEAALARLKCARSLAERFDARILGVAAEAIPPLAFDNGFVNYDALWIASCREAIDANLQAADKVFHERCDGYGAGDHLVSEMRLPATAMALACRGADLVVADNPRGASSYQHAPADELALVCGRPVLVVPQGRDHLQPDRVMVAWKDTRESRRALSDALPMLAEAGQVLVVEACPVADHTFARQRLAEVAEQLRRHGIHADVEPIDAGEAAEAAILRRAEVMCADLIVAGAYGHNRLGEWIFGGMTRSLLEQNDRFVLLSH